METEQQIAVGKFLNYFFGQTVGDTVPDIFSVRGNDCQVSQEAAL